MTAIEPKVSPTGRYGITEAAELLGVHRVTLNRETKRGNIKFGTRRYGRNQKFFTGNELLRYWRAQL